LTSELKKEIVAFANSSGGTVYIGIDDDGAIIGLPNANDVCLRVSNMIRDAIKPDVSMFTNCRIASVHKKNIVVVEVHRGTARPYYVAEKGLKPSGVYVRQGSASVSASENAIRQMIKETDGDRFENARSLIQELTFEVALREFSKRKLDLGGVQMKTLGVVNADNIFANLGLLLSDQCVHTIKVAVFSSSDKSEFKDRREFTGSLLKQLTGVYEYVDMYNKTKAEFFGLDRVDQRDYPEEAIREALLNAIVHRDYSFSGSTLINIYDNRIEFVSIGGLVKGISIDDIMLGISQPRNERLAAVFYRLKLIEAYGTGIAKIMGSYGKFSVKPTLRATDNAFMVSLPNLNTQYMGGLDKTRDQVVLEYLTMNGSITRKDVQRLLGIGQTAAGRILKDMVKRNLIKSVGFSRNTKYVLQKPHAE
jgi:ATP-dependent DNA helicase RecG